MPPVAHFSAAVVPAPCKDRINRQRSNRRRQNASITVL
jgi:hypothetical protein